LVALSVPRAAGSKTSADLRRRPYAARMRAMLVIWTTILVIGIVYFSIIGLTHH
jgi:hypothetical protein